MIHRWKHVAACCDSPSGRVKVKRSEAREVGGIRASHYLWSNFHFTFFTEASVWLAPENESCVHRIILGRNLRQRRVNLLFRISLTQFFPSCIICSVYCLRKSLHQASLLKEWERPAASPPPSKNLKHFTILIQSKKQKKIKEAKSQTSYFPLCISNMVSLRKRRIMLAEYIWTGIIIRGFSSAYMATKTQRRWFWKTTDDSNIKQNNPQ